MKFQLKTLTDYSDESLVAELVRVGALIPDAVLNRSTFRRLSRVHPSTYSKRFGSWRRALEVAGLAERFDASTDPLSRKAIVTALQQTAQALGTTVLSKKAFCAQTGISDRPIRRVFGTYRAALEAAGLHQSRGGVRYTNEDCFENLLAVWTAHGRQPHFSEMKGPPSRVGPKAYIGRWGSWRAALAAFVQRVNQDLPGGSAVPTPLPHLTSRPPKRSPRGVSLGLRWTVLSRDRYRCVRCGRSPATHPIALEVDHIIAWALGGETVIDNLRTLCHDCNLGKGVSREAG